MRTLAITNPTAEQIQNQANIEAVFLKGKIEYYLKCASRDCTSDLQLAGVIAVAWDNGCFDLVTELSKEYQAIKTRHELNTISGEGVRC